MSPWPCHPQCGQTRDRSVVAAAGEHSSTTLSPGSGLCHGPWCTQQSSLFISIHYLQKLEGLISHGGDSLPLLDFTQTQRPGRINRINSLLETEADSSLKSAEYKLLEFFRFDINIQILWHRHNSVKKRWWNSTTASWEEHLTQTKFSKIYYASHVRY